MRLNRNRFRPWLVTTANGSCYRLAFRHKITPFLVQMHRYRWCQWASYKIVTQNTELLKVIGWLTALCVMFKSRAPTLLTRTQPAKRRERVLHPITLP